MIGIVVFDQLLQFFCFFFLPPLLPPSSQNREFPRDSPQFLKEAENKDAGTSGDSSHLDPSLPVDSDQPAVSLEISCV